MEQQNRVRAWVFCRAKSIEEKLKGLDWENDIKTVGGDHFVIVRADIVDHDDYNVIIPVDAMDKSGLDEAVDVITEQLGVRIVSTVQVVEKGHFPDPPHNSNGFITEQEQERGDPDAPIGQVNRSPGWNAWG